MLFVCLSLSVFLSPCPSIQLSIPTFVCSKMGLHINDHHTIHDGPTSLTAGLSLIIQALDSQFASQNGPESVYGCVLGIVHIVLRNVQLIAQQQHIWDHIYAFLYVYLCIIRYIQEQWVSNYSLTLTYNKCHVSMVFQIRYVYIYWICASSA